MNTGSMGCLNCKKVTSTAEAKFFASVYLCPNCHAMATHFYARCDRELKQLLTMAKESIRIALLKGDFSFAEGPAGEVSKKDVLEQILQLTEAKK